MEKALLGNKQVMQRKAAFDQLLRDAGKKAVEWVDQENQCKLQEDTDNVHQNQQKKPVNHAQKPKPVSGKTPGARGNTARAGKTKEI